MSSHIEYGRKRGAAPVCFGSLSPVNWMQSSYVNKYVFSGINPAHIPQPQGKIYRKQKRNERAQS